MMIEPQSQLCVLNQTQSLARLRFRCDGAPLWDTWLAAGATLAAPDPLDTGIFARAIFIDPTTNVTYTVPSPITHAPVRLIAKKTVAAGARCFCLDQEPFDQPGKIGFVNLTAADLSFSLRFLDSPFHLALSLAPQARYVQGLSMDVSATIDGVTVVSAPIASWASDVTVEMGEVDFRTFPRIKVAPREQSGDRRFNQVS